MKMAKATAESRNAARKLTGKPTKHNDKDRVLDFLSNLTIRQKNWLIAGVSGFATAATLYLALALTVDAVFHERRLTTQTLTEAAHSLIESNYKRYTAGELDEEEAKAQAVAAIRAIRYGENGYYFIHTREGIAVLNPGNTSLEGKSSLGFSDPNGVLTTQAMIAVSGNGKGGFVEYQWPKTKGGEPADKAVYAKGFAPWNWFVATGAYEADMFETVIETFSRSKGLLLLATGIFITSMVLLSLVNRDTRRQILQIKSHLEAFAKGKFTRNITWSGRDEFAQMLESCNEVQSSMCNTLGELKRTAISVRSGIDQIASNNQKLAGRSQEQADNISNTNQNLSHAASSVKENNTRLLEARDAAASSQETAAKGEQVVQQAISAMDAITTSSEQVTDIVNVIDEIAFQTNLLALNAAVEAARAGEQGKGFAVVATEVRSLASRSASSASEIKTLIEQSVSNVRAGSKLVSDSGGILNEILSSSQQVSSLISEISTSTSTQTTSIESSSNAMSNVDSFVQENNNMVNHVTSASENLRQEAESLLHMVERFEISRAA